MFELRLQVVSLYPFREDQDIVHQLRDSVATALLIKGSMGRLFL